MPEQIVRILAFVHASERPAWQEVRSRLQEALGGTVRIELLLPERRSGEGLADGDVICVSLLPWLVAADGWEATETEVRSWFGALPRAGSRPGLGPACVCTIFRHLPRALAESRSTDGMGGIERVRRLNLLAARLSQEGGLTVIDLDRSLAHAGARALDTDCFLGGLEARRLASAVIASTLAQTAMDDLVPEALLAPARQLLATASLALPADAPPPEVLERLHGRGRAPDGPIDSQATAIALLDAGDIDGAEAEAARLCLLAPALPGAFVVHARCAEARGDWATAEKRWRLCLDRFPGRVMQGWPALASILTRLGRIGEVRALWETAHAAEPENPQPMVGLANMAMRDKDNARAIVLYRRAIDTTGGKPVPHWRMSLVRALLAAGDTVQALAEARELLAFVPDYQPALDCLTSLEGTG